jgi:hypothetical protein
MVILTGRGYPSPDAAIAAMRQALAKDGLEVPDEDIEARRWTPESVFCPWEAVALIPDKDES